MTKFNPKGKEELTIVELMQPITQITTKNEAERYMQDYIQYIIKVNPRLTEKHTYRAQKIAESNIIHFLELHNRKTRRKIKSLFSIN